MLNQRELNHLLSFITPERHARFLEVLNLRTRYFTVVLEDLFQSHNISAIMRTCEAMGVQDVHIIENRNSYNPEALIDRGASRWITAIRYNKNKNNTEQALTALRKRGYRILAASPDAEKSIENFRPISPTALLLGTEKEGVSQIAKNLVDDTVRIPMKGLTESLNVSVCAALMLQQLFQNGSPQPLSASERHDILSEWVYKSVRMAPKILDRFREEIS